MTPEHLFFIILLANIIIMAYLMYSISKYMDKVVQRIEKKDRKEWFDYLKENGTSETHSSKDPAVWCHQDDEELDG